MLSKKEIEALLSELNGKLAERKIVGELYLVGGAVMCLAYEARPAMKDVDGYFVPKKEIQAAAEELAGHHGLARDWLNDAVKGFLSEKGGFSLWMDKSNLKVFMPEPAYLLALKCLAMRLGREFSDESDVRYLLRFLNIDRYDRAVQAISRYYPIERFPQKTLYALEEILEEDG